MSKRDRREADARRHLGATRSRWTEAEGWTTPPEDLAPLAPRNADPSGAFIVILGLLALAAIAWLALVVSEVR